MLAIISSGNNGPRGSAKNEYADLDAQRALYTCVAAGLVAVAAVSFYATANHRQPCEC